MHHDFDYFSKKMNKRNKKSIAWSKKTMEEKEFMTLLEETIIKVKKEVMGRFFFPKVEASSFMKTNH